MANGTENLLNYGSAQVLPQGANPMALVQQLNRQKAYKDETDRYNQRVAKQEEKDLYGIVGDALNLRDFNPVIHDNVRKAKSDLAKQLMTNKPSLGEAHLLAQNFAQELGAVSDQFNQADKLIALSKEEYKGDKRLNLGNVEALARKDLLNQYKTTGKIDLSENPFDRALNNNPDFALTDNSDYGVVDFKNARMQPLDGSFTKINRKGGMDKMTYKTQYYPDLYDIDQRGEDQEPILTTKSGGDFNGNPMLGEEAYGFYKLTPSNVVALNKRIKRKYGDIDLGSEEAEKLRRVEAYNDVESKKPQVISSPVHKADPERSASFYVAYGGQGQGDTSLINKVYERMDKKIQEQLDKGFGGTRFNALANDEQKVVKEAVEAAGYEVDEGGKNLFLHKDANGKIKVFKVKDDGTLVIKPEYEIATLGYEGTNVKNQINVQGKKQTVGEGQKRENTSQQQKIKNDPLGIR